MAPSSVNRLSPLDAEQQRLHSGDRETPVRPPETDPLGVGGAGGRRVGKVLPGRDVDEAYTGLGEEVRDCRLFVLRPGDVREGQAHQAIGRDGGSDWA